MNMDDRIFVCYASEEKTRVEEICKRLEGAGLNPWMDKEDSPLAKDREKEIEENIQSARFILIFFSNQLASESGSLHREIDIVLRTAQKMPKDRIFIIPVRLDECEVSQGVRHLQHIDLFEEKGFDKVVELIRGELRLFTDLRDNQVYQTIEIGDRTWMAQNLNHEVEDSWWYDNDPTNGRRYGRLYTWEAAQEACPAGWHIPSDKEWQRLAMSFGGSWEFIDTADTYEALIEGGKSGFHALLGGIYDNRAVFKGFHEKLMNGYYWGGDTQSGIYTFAFSAKSGRRLFRGPPEDDLGRGYSCRCVQNL